MIIRTRTFRNAKNEIILVGVLFPVTIRKTKFDSPWNWAVFDTEDSMLKIGACKNQKYAWDNMVKFAKRWGLS